MKDVMLDLETLGNGPRPVIVAIGAVFFDEKGLGETLYVRVDPQSCVELGLEMDVSTVLWWMGQEEAARKELARPAVSIRSALDLLTAFLRSGASERELCVWGNGASADNVWMANAYRAAGQAAPWKFWGDRCYRTVKNMRPEIAIERGGTHHNALDDAKSQALHLIKIWGAEKSLAAPSP